MKALHSVESGIVELPGKLQVHMAAPAGWIESYYFAALAHAI